jgi:hypothetical protein
MPDVTFTKTMPPVDGNPDVSFKPHSHEGQSTFENVAPPAGENTPQLRDGTVYIAAVHDKGRHKSESPARGQGLIRETPVIEVIH